MKKLIIFVIFCFLFILKIQGVTITRIESVQSLYIEVFRDNRRLGRATGFIIKRPSNYYLITNWHVVTNKNPISKQWINPQVPISPNIIKIYHHSDILGNYMIRTEKLVNSIGNIFFEEFTENNITIDVIALPLKDTTGNISFYPVPYQNTTESIILTPMERVFILGFPKGIKSAPFFPIWKSGLLASEPEFDQEGKPIIWVDIESYPGMSGSPVYYISNEIQETKGRLVKSTRKKSFFIGVFSHELNANINVGGIWKGTYLKNRFGNLK